ncbi:unnamed protein product [Lactuca saligna]|uniref:Uncharacterized protein n=1 Tax=Lactuca saligna TaxID=75948 RepID=A0AA35ZZ14_LACSI|nr:unnamed protein product [Lactuca saligna]
MSHHHPSRLASLFDSIMATSSAARFNTLALIRMASQKALHVSKNAITTTSLLPTTFQHLLRLALNNGLVAQPLPIDSLCIPQHLCCLALNNSLVARPQPIVLSLIPKHLCCLALGNGLVAQPPPIASSPEWIESVEKDMDFFLANHLQRVGVRCWFYRYTEMDKDRACVTRSDLSRPATKPCFDSASGSLLPFKTTQLHLQLLPPETRATDQIYSKETESKSCRSASGSRTV